ncbi:MAG: HEAT repeat domain-containing protein [Acidimicrobiales bacterium]
MAGDKAEQALLGLLHDASELVRVAAARGLGVVSSWALAPNLARQLSDPAWDVRREAALAFRRLGPAGHLYLRRRSSIPIRTRPRKRTDHRQNGRADCWVTKRHPGNSRRPKKWINHGSGIPEPCAITAPPTCPCRVPPRGRSPDWPRMPRCAEPRPPWWEAVD